MANKELMTEEEYYGDSVSYALNIGFVREDEVESFKRRYLDPIYEKCIRAVSEVAEALKGDPDESRLVTCIIGDANQMLEVTKKIGSTAPWDITNSALNYCETFCNGNDYRKYCAMEILESISEVLQ